MSFLSVLRSYFAGLIWFRVLHIYFVSSLTLPLQLPSKEYERLVSLLGNMRTFRSIWKLMLDNSDTYTIKWSRLRSFSPLLCYSSVIVKAFCTNRSAVFLLFPVTHKIGAWDLIFFSGKTEAWNGIDVYVWAYRLKYWNSPSANRSKNENKTKCFWFNAPIMENARMFSNISVRQKLI